MATHFPTADAEFTQYLAVLSHSRLVVADMDGTLLDDDSSIPDEFWEVLDTLDRRGVIFAPASGRQADTLEQMFDRSGIAHPIIGENGAIVRRSGEILAMSPIAPETVAWGIAHFGQHSPDNRPDRNLVICGAHSAYIEAAGSCPEFFEEARKYYVRLQVVEDFSLVDDAVLKLAVCDLSDIPDSLRICQELEATHQVSHSGQIWLDVMRQGVNKGAALHALRESLGISYEETLVFGDYLNDLEMMSEGFGSFAMANAMPGILDAARFIAPTNSDKGVVTVLKKIFCEG